MKEHFEKSTSAAVWLFKALKAQFAVTQEMTQNEPESIEDNENLIFGKGLTT